MLYVAIFFKLLQKCLKIHSGFALSFIKSFKIFCVLIQQHNHSLID